MEYIGKFTFYIISIVIGVILGGLIVMNFWEWFIYPVFNFKMLTYSESVGISVFLTLLKTASYTQKPTVETHITVITSLIYQLLILGFGWLISLFI